MNEPGPTVPDAHYDEMSEQDLRNLNAYLHAALTHALRHALGDDIVEVLTEWYDEVFIALAGSSDRFRERVLEGDVFPPGGQSVRKKYRELAMYGRVIENDIEIKQVVQGPLFVSEATKLEAQFIEIVGTDETDGSSAIVDHLTEEASES